MESFAPDDLEERQCSSAGAWAVDVWGGEAWGSPPGPLERDALPRHFGVHGELREDCLTSSEFLLQPFLKLSQQFQRWPDFEKILKNWRWLQQLPTSLGNSERKEVSGHPTICCHLDIFL